MPVYNVLTTKYERPIKIDAAKPPDLSGNVAIFHDDKDEEIARFRIDMIVGFWLETASGATRRGAF